MSDKEIKKIQVMPDFSSTGLWNLEDHGTMIDYQDLKMSKGLIKDFKHWIDEVYETCFKRPNYDMIASKVPAMNEMGLELATRLKKELPNCYVEYRGESCKDLLPPEVIDEQVTI